MNGVGGFVGRLHSREITQPRHPALRRVSILVCADDVGSEEIRRRDAALPRLTVATVKILKD